MSKKKSLSKLRKKYGKDVIKKGGMNEIKKFPTGIVTLDQLLQGGWPRGRWSMIFGQKATCKTSLCKYTAGKVQNDGGEVLVVDAENTWDPDYADQLGMDANKAYYSRPSTVEEMGSVVNDFAPHVDLVVVDSIVSVSSEQEKERELEDDTMALIPRKLSQFFRMTNPVVGKSNAIVILVNQVRTNFAGHYAFDDFSGGNALGHYTSVILKTSRGKSDDNPTRKIDGKKKEVGFNFNIELKKTKISSTEGQSVNLNYYYKEPHFREEDDLFTAALVENIIEKNGSWYQMGDVKAQGKESFQKKMREDEELFNKIKEEL